MTDYYQILGVSKTATFDEIKHAFRSLVKKYHPDVATDKKSAEEKFKQISEAYEVLSNPDKRASYDHSGLPMVGFNWDKFTRAQDLMDVWNDLQLRWLMMNREQLFNFPWQNRETLKKGNCKDCDGTGQKRTQSQYRNGPNEYISIHIKPCEKCNGTSNIKT